MALQAEARAGFDFLLQPAGFQLGEGWFNQEMAKPLQERHIILQWRNERAQQFRKYQDPAKPDANVRAPSTRGMRALQVLAEWDERARHFEVAVTVQAEKP